MEHEHCVKQYDKLFFLWYFDDAEGYGIEIMGLREQTAQGRVFDSLVKWSFGHGVEARDLRRKWGDFVAGVSSSHNSSIPSEILSIKLQYKPDSEPQLQGNLQEILALLSQAADTDRRGE